jgi:DNA-binding CsgD family transcriptional regulator
MDSFDDILTTSQFDAHELEQLDRGSNVGDFQNVIRKLIEAYGLSNAVYWCPTFRGRALDDPFLVVTYKPDWVDHYIRSNYAAVDPVVNIGARSLLPIDWAKFDRSPRKVQRMFNESRDAGVGAQGLTIPVRGAENGVWGLFSVTSNDKDAEWTRRRRAIISDLVMIANFVHHKAYDLHTLGENIDLNAITKRETEALAWTSEGKSIADIAVLMQISAETVKAHLDSARHKLGALNRVHAVSKAIRHGIIS